MATHIIKNPGDRDSIFMYSDGFLSESEQHVLIEHFDSMRDFHACPSYHGIPNRWQKWYQEDGEYFCPAWTTRFPRWESNEYTKTIRLVQKKVQNMIDNSPILNCQPYCDKPSVINSCFVNKYLGYKNNIKPHRDSPQSFGEYPLIVGVSLGAERTIKFDKVIYNPKNPKSLKLDTDTTQNFSFALKSGSIFVMAGASQKYYVHSIPKVECKIEDEDEDEENDDLDNNEKNSVRYSMTFRQFCFE